MAESNTGSGIRPEMAGIVDSMHSALETFTPTDAYMVRDIIFDAHDQLMFREQTAASAITADVIYREIRSRSAQTMPPFRVPSGVSMWFELDVLQAYETTKGYNNYPSDYDGLSFDPVASADVGEIALVLPSYAAEHDEHSLDAYMLYVDDRGDDAHQNITTLGRNRLAKALDAEVAVAEKYALGPSADIDEIEPGPDQAITSLEDFYASLKSIVEAAAQQRTTIRSYVENYWLDNWAEKVAEYTITDEVEMVGAYEEYAKINEQLRVFVQLAQIQF